MELEGLKALEGLDGLQSRGGADEIPTGLLEVGIAGAPLFAPMWRTAVDTLLLREGVFNNPAPGMTVYLRERGADGEFRGILVHDNRDRENPVTYMAERGALVVSESGPRVVMVNGNQQPVTDWFSRRWAPHNCSKAIIPLPLNKKPVNRLQ